MTTAIVAPTDAQLAYLAASRNAKALRLLVSADLRLMSEIDRLRRVVAAQREALRFYAAESTYEESTEPHPTRFATGVVPIEADHGRWARKVLDAEGAAP